jgi:ABC-type transporter Mla subunit MlaD
MSPPNKDLVSFTVQDLTLLMEAYRNNVEISTTLLEQLKQISSNQDNSNSLNNTLHQSILKFTDTLNQSILKVNESIVKTNEGISKLNTDFVREQERLKTLIQGAYVGMGSIIIALIGLFIIVFKK